MFRLPAPNGRYRRDDTRSHQQRESGLVCAPVRVCVRECESRLGSQGHLRHTIAHVCTSTHTHTRSLCSSSVSSTREMEGTTQRWIYDLGDRRAFRVQTPNSSSISAMQLLFLLLFLPLAWLSQSLHDPNCVLFLSLIFHAVFCFFFAPIILCRKHIWNAVSLQKKIQVIIS